MAAPAINARIRFLPRPWSTLPRRDLRRRRRFRQPPFGRTGLCCPKLAAKGRLWQVICAESVAESESRADRRSRARSDRRPRDSWRCMQSCETGLPLGLPWKQAIYQGIPRKSPTDGLCRPDELIDSNRKSSCSLANSLKIRTGKNRELVSHGRSGTGDRALHCLAWLPLFHRTQGPKRKSISPLQSGCRPTKQGSRQSQMQGERQAERSLNGRSTGRPRPLMPSRSDVFV